MRLPDVKTVIGSHHFQRFGMHSIYRYMHMIISGVVVQSVNCLVSFQSHLPEKKFHKLVHLFACRLLSLRP